MPLFSFLLFELAAPCSRSKIDLNLPSLARYERGKGDEDHEDVVNTDLSP